MDLEQEIVYAQTQNAKKKPSSRKPLHKLINNLNEQAEILEKITMTPLDQHMFANKLWKVAEDFAEQLEYDERGWKLEKRRLE